MGLDIVEFIIGVEDAFCLSIPDQDASSLDTPRRLIDYIAGRLPRGPAPLCLSQRAFYKLRKVICRRIKIPRAALRPSTDLLEMIPEERRAAIWGSIANDLRAGASAPKSFAMSWPRLAANPGWFETIRSPRLNQLGDMVKFLVARNPWLLLHAGEGWTRQQIVEVVHALIWDQFRIRRNQYTEDSRWVQDMGID